MVVSAQPLGSVSKDDDEGSDNVVKKMICHLSKFIAPFWTPSGVEFSRTFSKIIKGLKLVVVC